METNGETTSEHGSVPPEAVEDAGHSGPVQAADGHENKVEESSCNLSEAPADSAHEIKAAVERLKAGDLYTVRDIESLFRISRRTVTNWQYAGILKPVMVGRVLRFRRDDIEKLVATT